MPRIPQSRRRRAILYAVCALAWLCLLPMPVLAGDAQPFGDFTFKRVKPPVPGARRITVQIEAPPALPAAPAPTEHPAAGAVAAGGQFWDNVPVSGSGAGGLDLALAALRADATVRAPRLETLAGLADRHGRDILAATIGTRVSPALALAVLSVESAGQAGAVSSAGAQGLMQLMPATAARFGVTDSFAAAQNIRGGVAYLDWLMDEFAGDPVLVLAAYNAGEGTVRRHGGVPPYAETRDYVPKVMAAFGVARGLCLTQPMLVSDGCVFVQRTAFNG